jgi:hypothetical protein
MTTVTEKIKIKVKAVRGKITHSISLLVCLMALNATFNNISVTLWQSVLLVEETGGPGENHRPVASH